VEQNASLYALAEAVLKSAGLKEDEYAIDESLQDIIIPWAWLPSMDHREALRVISGAGLAVCYCGRDGRVNMTRPTTPDALTEAVVYFIQGASFPAEFGGGGSAGGTASGLTIISHRFAHQADRMRLPTRSL